jgi:hypothetical protein
MALVHYSDQMSFDEVLRNTDHRYASGFIDDEYVALLKRCSSGASSNDEMQRTVGWIVHKFKANGNLKVETGTPEWREAARALALAELESLRRTAERDDGDFTGKPDHPLLTEQPKSVDPKNALSVRILGHDSTKTLAELLPLFLKERGATGRSDYDSEVTVRMLDEVLEEARPVYRITRADITAYKRALSETPSIIRNDSAERSYRLQSRPIRPAPLPFRSYMPRQSTVNIFRSSTLCLIGMFEMTSFRTTPRPPSRSIQ